MDYYDDLGTKPLIGKAEEGDAAACLELSYRYIIGTDLLNRNEEKAFSWFKKSNVKDYKEIVPYFKKKSKVIWMLLKYNEIDKAVSLVSSLEDSVEKVRSLFDVFHIIQEVKYYNEAVSLCESITKCINLYIEDDWEIAQFYKFIYEQTQDEKYRDEAMSYFKSLIDNRLEERRDNPTGKYVLWKKVFIDPILHELIALSHNSHEERRFLIASLDVESIESIEEYNKVNEHVISCFDIAYEYLYEVENKFGTQSVEYKKEREDWDNMLFSDIDYNERKIIYLAKDINDLAGCYNKDISWFFTIDKYPNEIIFPEGHPLPNTLYIAIPTRKARYAPLKTISKAFAKELGKSLNLNNSYCIGNQRRRN